MLSDRAKHLLHEIYLVTYEAETVITEGYGTSPSPTLFDVQLGVKERLNKAIAFIDLDESKIARISEILEEYDNWALDYSTIDREGYSMRPNRNLKRVRAALYPYTGIMFATGGSNKMPLG